MGLPPQIPGSRPRHPFGRRAFATGMVVAAITILLALLLITSDDPDTRGAGIAMVVLAGVSLVVVGLLTLAERLVARRRDD